MPTSDAQLCADIASTHARTFALASKLLPSEKRRGVFALYALCRTADDIVDRPPAGTTVDDRTHQLRAFGERVFRALDGAPDDALARELAWASHRFAVPRSAIEELLAGVALDLDGVTYHSWEELERYCQGVASSVGEMCTAVFGIGGSAETHPRTIKCARTLGVAMQLTNVLRDVGEDAARGRCYLPSEDLARFGFTAEDVLRRTPLTRLPQWRAAMQHQIARARTLYREAIPGIAGLESDAQSCASACASGYARILDAIELNGCDNFTSRARVAWPTRARVLFDAWRGRSPVPPDDLTAAVA